jgi:hypothetical protein
MMADFNRSKQDLFRGGGNAGGEAWTRDESFWRENYASRPYARADQSFDYYSPAYRYGYDAASRYPNREWTDIEPELEKGWDEFRGETKSTWEEIKQAAKDAWDRVTGSERDESARRDRPEVGPDTRL